MRIISYVLLLFVIVVGISFATLNSSMVNINYYIGHRALPLSLLLALVLASGCLLGLIVGMMLLVKAKLKIYRLHQQLKLAEKEIENLRAIPLQNKH